MATAELDLRLTVEDGDAAEVEQATAQLRRELLALDVEDVRAPSGGPAPEGSRGAELAQAGALLVTVLGTPGVLSATVATLREWLGRRPHSTIALTVDGDTLTLTGPTAQQQEQLVRAWLDRHG